MKLRVDAEKFNKHPQRIYEEAAEKGSVIINHMHYRDKIFELVCRDRRTDVEEPPFCRVESKPI